MNENAKRRQFNLFDDPHYEMFTRALNDEMIISANLGLVAGKKKNLRDPVKPEYLRKVFELDWKNVPLYLEYIIVLNVMLLLAIRGGRELAEDLNWGQFSLKKDSNGNPMY